MSRGDKGDGSRRGGVLSIVKSGLAQSFSVSRIDSLVRCIRSHVAHRAYTHTAALPCDAPRPTYCPLAQPVTPAHAPQHRAVHTAVPYNMAQRPPPATVTCSSRSSRSLLARVGRQVWTLDLHTDYDCYRPAAAGQEEEE